MQTPKQRKPLIFGIYGLPGSGKTTLVHDLHLTLGDEHFRFYDGSSILENLVPGGLTAFKSLPDTEKKNWREQAIGIIEYECRQQSKTGIVAGHYMFWDNENDTQGEVAHTQKDMQVYTHIIYLDPPAEELSRRRTADTGRSRPNLSIKHLRKWQLAEKDGLRQDCYENQVLFKIVSGAHDLESLKRTVAAILRGFCSKNEHENFDVIKRYLDTLLADRKKHLETVLILDADRTLTAADSGEMLWKCLGNRRSITQLRNMFGNEEPLNELFKSNTGMSYSFNAFQQAALIHEQILTDDIVETFCNDVGCGITMHPELVQLLNSVAQVNHVQALVVTCGLQRIWERVIARYGLSGYVKVIGNGRTQYDPVIITPDVKAQIVTYLQGDNFKARVVALGDSPVDIPMLKTADEAIIVTGDVNNRSRSMDHCLLEAFENGELLEARQTILPIGAAARLPGRLKEAKIDDEFLSNIIRHRGINIVIAPQDSHAVQLLQTPTRNGQLNGAALRDAHYQVGRYLATEIVTKVIGLEEFNMKHVKKGKEDIIGYRLKNERETLIVPLLRGGEPMSFGVWDAFPLAMFQHAHEATDIKAKHLEGRKTVLLVDSVVNTGKSIDEIIRHIHGLDKSLRIVVIANIVQIQSIQKGGKMLALGKDIKFDLITLRTSETSFVGSKETDTGNRLFNSTHMV
ncbi:uracil phosphoribosyltransferase-domain-containing protein [Lophiotrema nucula]|uniref:Uracil phosphoribosyltransferase-domain-containing protein n=1 Tax=Lophiotrema nucula TaxID=690887 RepID=A0A6A5YL31_9PLEO|nr:uracil phosphoribosyltransferase-domain-containing protein [Lophiotrema nucula]